MRPFFTRGFNYRALDELEEFSVEEHLICTSIPPYDFYHLKPGATGKIKPSESAKPSLQNQGNILWTSLRLLPLSPHDIAYLYHFSFKMWRICPDLWSKYV